jgi:transposase
MRGGCCAFQRWPETIQYWAKRFNEDGVEGLRDAARPGRRSCLSEEYKEILEQDLRRPPREFEYSQNLWDGKLLSYHLKQKFNVELKVRRCQTLFHELGFRRRKPRPVIAKADKEAQEAYKKLKELATNDERDVWFMDECRFQQHGSQKMKKTQLYGMRLREKRLALLER